MNWREIPLFRLLLPLLSGILMAFHLDWQGAIYLMLLSILCLLLVLFYLHLTKVDYLRRNYFGYSLNVCLFLIAYLHTWHYLDIHHPQHFQKHLDQENILLGTVQQSSSKSKSTEYRIRVEGIRLAEDELKPCTGNLLFYVPKDSLLPYQQGDQIAFRASVRPVQSSGNPEAFDYAKYLRQQNIYYQAYAKKEAIHLVQSAAGKGVFSTAKRLQDFGSSILRQHLHSDREWMVGKALLLGHRSDLGQNVRQAYAATGAMHVLAVSGLHVGIICLILQFFLRFLGQSRSGKCLRTGTVLLSIWSFALVTGASASVLRAATLFSFILIGQHLKHFININNTLAASAFLLLLVNPLLLFDVGFQLSYTAVLGIIHLQKRIYRLLFLPNKLLDYMWQITSVSIAAQIATLPLSIFYFHQFPVYFWLSGLLLIPAAFLIICLGLLVIFLDPIVIVSFYLGKLLFALIWLCNQFIFLIGMLPGHLVSDLWLSWATVLVLYAVLILMLLARIFEQLRFLNMALFLLLCLSITSTWGRWKATQHREITIYHIRKHSLIDFVDGHRRTSLLSENLEYPQINWAASNYRSSLGIRDSMELQFEHTQVSERPHFYYRKGFIQFHELRGLILDANYEVQAGSGLCVELVMIRNNPRIDIGTILHDYAPTYLVIDASNRHSNIKIWKRACAEWGFKPIVLSETGAFQLDLNHNYH